MAPRISLQPQERTALTAIAQQSPETLLAKTQVLGQLLTPMSKEVRLAIIEAVAPDMFQDLKPAIESGQGNGVDVITAFLEYKIPVFQQAINDLLRNDAQTTTATPSPLKANETHEGRTTKELAIAVSDMDEARLRTFIQQLSKPESIQVLLLSPKHRDTDFSTMPLETLRMNVGLMLGRGILDILHFKNLLRKEAGLIALKPTVATHKPKEHGLYVDQFSITPTSHGQGDAWSWNGAM